ncbi:Lrp/AsnC ligand binding domain-containing protein [Micromonospora sp. NBC_01699]|uniref:Lrp/AsnC ligand binding domain-containing protein n=1 Tax=Micromonospora sp. NBC_01699 TaxID=2975984 RepID=UPI002E36AF74|nr:Lrp/AsnC ligand binding domain-containing protein [Micromonospora sp. NBC_01699]
MKIRVGRAAERHDRHMHSPALPRRTADARPRPDELLARTPTRIEALVCVRLAASTVGGRFARHLRTDPRVVAAWWVAADIDLMVRLSCTSLTELNIAVADLRLRGGATETVTHLLLRPLDIPERAPADPEGDPS